MRQWLVMLSLGKISGGPQAARYYTDQVALGREDYYAGKGEAPGWWIGSAALAAGLKGLVDAGQLEHLLAGGGLRSPVRERAVAGFDLTFRAPKSVSVLWGIADTVVAGQLGQAHDAAVEAALGYVEREACRARRGAGGVTQVRGSGLVAAAFRHRASRAGDPVLHTHVVAGNLTQGADGRWTALDARHLYRHAKTAGFLYQAELRREITERLGLEWGTVERGTADIEGVPRGVIEHFSQRRAEILRHMAEHDGRSAKSAQVAALETRRSKEEIDSYRMREQWRARATEHGLDAHTLTRITRPRERDVPSVASASSEALTRDAGVFGRAELLQVLAEAQPRGASIPDLEHLAEATLASGEVVALPDGPAPAGLSERRYTTWEMLGIEQDLVDYATEAVGTLRGTAPELTVRSALRNRALSTEQESVVAQLCTRGDGVAVLRSPAGTGKTFVLDAARQAWQSSRREVMGCSLSARAALELHDQTAIPTSTIAQLTNRLDHGARLPDGAVLVVDEAGMVGTRELARLAAAAASARGKLVLVGDDRQLPEIQAGGGFHALAERLPVCELREVRRQHNAWDRRALDELRSGEVERWARAYRQHGRITVGATAAATRAALVNDWSRAEGDRLMIAARRDDVADLNHRARLLLQARGDLGRDEMTIDGRGFSVGDRVVGTRNDRLAGILNGQRGTVTTAHVRARTLDVQLDNGRHVQLGPDYLQAGSLDHGYATTAHRAQGATVDRTFVLGGEELHREWGYTALSRHRQEARFYVAGGDLRPDGDKPPPQDPVVAGLTRLLERTQAKELALDSLPSAAREQLERDRRRVRAHRSRPAAATRPLLTAALDRKEALLAQRDQMRRAARDARVDAGISRAQERHKPATALWTATDLADRQWLAAYGPGAARLHAIEGRLPAQDAADPRAVDHRLSLELNPLRRPLAVPPDDLDLGR
jgi:conjugative relaxase-like TrwC/TraI family protein